MNLFIFFTSINSSVSLVKSRQVLPYEIPSLVMPFDQPSLFSHLLVLLPQVLLISPTWLAQPNISLYRLIEPCSINCIHIVFNHSFKVAGNVIFSEYNTFNVDYHISFFPFFFPFLLLIFYKFFTAK